jgi:tetratricopeptide (TPR) repeat protein
MKPIAIFQIRLRRWFTVLLSTSALAQPCATCHSEIAKTYAQTVMARASGPATEGLVTGEFTHRPSGIHFRIYLENGKAWMSYDRPNDPEVHGKRELLYSIGSGIKGKTYLFSEKGFLFETPINWYAQEGRWNMAPAYTEAQAMPMTLPALTDCLHCHASGMIAPVQGTENLYDGEPFVHGGITCERCHGSGDEHAGAGKGAIVNPAKVSPERRDSICMQCHFEGSVAIEQRGRHLHEFRPGDSISDYVHYFLLEEAKTDTRRALSQFEALSLSVCKQKSGDRMSCTSCHDPHVEPATGEKVAYYRGKCLTCHGEAFGRKHHANKPDCAGCHMPALPSAAVAHTEATDHHILRRPSALQLASLTLAPRLTPFPATVEPTVRDLALAWETLAQRNMPGASQPAERYLKQAIKESPDDSVLLVSAAFLKQGHGHFDEARNLYERALKLDPYSNAAATNLGVLEAHSGNLTGAVQLWQEAFRRSPHRSAIGMNLATAFCAAGQTKEARNYVLQVLDFNPDLAAAKRLLRSLNRDPPSCGP